MRYEAELDQALAHDGSDPLGVVQRGDRALDERDVVRALDGRARCLEEVGDLELVGVYVTSRAPAESKRSNT